MTSFLQRARGAAGSFSYAQYEKEISLPTPRLCKKTIGKGDKKMKSKKAVRSALGMSVLSIALCAAMLIGTTFAWFTDTASTAVNKIQAGTLKVDIVKAENGGSIKGESMSFVNKDGSDDILWEPGVTFRTPAFQIKNIGTLAIKYKLALSGVTGSSKLLKVIQFSVVKNDGTAVDLDKFEGTLTLEGDSVLSEPLYIQGHMEETAGNEYQNETLEGLGITVYATQYTYEYDSKDNQYDFDSDYTEVVAGGRTFTGTEVISTGITATGVNAIAVKAVGPDANVTITGGSFDGGSGGNNQCVHVREGATVTIKGGTFTVGSDASGEGNSVIESNGGNITIEGGFFYTDYNWNGFYYVLNQQNNNPGTITVKGGTFVNYDPSKGDDNLHGNFVAEGYSVLTQVQPNGDIWYTVVKGTGVTPGTQEDLNNGIKDATEKDVTVVMPKNSSFTLDNDIANEGAKSRDITFVGDGTQTVDVASNAPAAEGAGHLNYQRGSTFTFKNLTIENGTNTYDGIVCDELVYENCTIKGVTTLYGKATFINCTFENTMANQYSIWTWGGTDVKFDGCTFNTNGKAILLYGQATAEKPTNMVVNNCVFNDRNNGSAGKAAIEIGNDYNATYTLTVNNATVNGFAAGKNTGSTLWANKNSMGADHLTVTIDGVKVELQ